MGTQAHTNLIIILALNAKKSENRCSKTYKIIISYIMGIQNKKIN